jgi:hypothetical protein
MALLGAWRTLPHQPFSLLWFITSLRGAEWFHLYLWMMKDLAWTQNM